MLEKWSQLACSMQGCHKASICKTIKQNKTNAVSVKHKKAKHNEVHLPELL